MSVEVKETRQFTLLQNITQHIASGAATEDILRQVSRQLLAEFGYRAVQIYQLSTGGKEVWLYLELGHGNKPLSQTPDFFSIDEDNLISEAARRNELIYVSNLKETPYAYYTAHPETLTGSEIALPLRFGEELVGVLRIECLTPHGFTPNDISFLTGLGHLLATVIRNNRKIAQLEDSIQEIKTLYTIQHTDRLEQQRHLNLNRSLGYEYDQSAIFKTDRLPELSHLADVTAGVVTHQQNGHQELLAPIQLHGQTVGVLGLEANTKESTPWSDDDIRLLEEVSLQVSLAIENARLLQQTQEQANELSILFEATRQLAETIDLQAIYKILNAQTINYVNANRSTVLLLNPARTHFEAIVSHHRDSHGQPVFTPITRMETIEDNMVLGWLLKNPAMLIHHLDDPSLPPEVRQYMTRLPETKIFTLTYFPLIVRSRLVGVMEVEHFYQRHLYTPNELQLAQAIISQVTVAIENAQLFQQTQIALENTQNLYQISRSLVESTSLDEVFNIILETVKSYQVDRVSISLINRGPTGEIEQSTIAASWDRDPAYQLPIGTAFSTKNFSLVSAFSKPPFHPLISHDLRQPHGQDERMDNAFREYVVNGLNAVTLFSAPMFLGAEYKGVLSIYTRQPHQYTEEEIRVYQTLADQAIIAIENYRLLNATRLERDRASLLYELGRSLSYTTSVEEVQRVVLGFIAQLGAIDGELFITDGDEYASLASTVAERQNLPAAQITNLIHSNSHEALALNRHQILTLHQDDPTDDWPLTNLPGLEAFKMLVTVPFFSQRSALQGVLNLYHTRPDAFTEDQIATFEAVTIQMSASLENAWLLRQTNLVLRETELLYNVTRGFNSAQTVSDLVAVITQNMPNQGIDSLWIALLDQLTTTGKAEQMTTITTWAKSSGHISNVPVPLNSHDYPFILRLSSQLPVEIHYHRLDSTSQTNIDRHLFGSRTLLAIPLSVGNAWLGVILLGSQKANFPFKLNITGQMTTLAQQAAIVIQNLELVQETQHRLVETEILSTLAQQLLTAETLDTIYRLTLDSIAATEPDRGAAIFMVDQIEGSVDIELTAGWDNPSQSWATIPIGTHLSSEQTGLVAMIKSGQTVVSLDGPADERFSPTLKQLLQSMQIKVMVAVPLWLKKEVGGFILISHATDRPFTASHIRLYEAIAREASGALYNRQLFDEVHRRAWQLETAGAISQAASAYLDLNSLLFESVELIKQRFDFYHASIFLLDEYHRYAVVAASTGEIGQKMIELGHKLEVGGRSMVGTATGTGKPCIALDVGKDAVHFNNPLLPLTRSEMALPLIAQGRVMGALDVQSTRRGAFSDSDITVLQSMANQLANAIEVARAYQESKKALDEVSILHQKYMLDQWSVFLHEQESTLGFHLTEDGRIEKLDKQTLSPANILEKHPRIVPVAPPAPDPTNDEWARLVAPLTLYGQSVIGEVDFDIPKASIDGLLEEDILDIIEAVSEQTAQAVEAARLFEQSQVARQEAEALYQVGRSLVTIEDEIEMFNLILGKLLSTLGLPQGGVLLFEDDRQTGRLHALYRDNVRVDNPQVTFPVAGNESYRKLIETKQPVAIDDMATDPLVARVREMNLVGNIASLLLVPIIINDEVVGAVGADSVGHIHHFTSREMNLAMAMADQLSISLQNRRLIEETRRRAILLQTSAEVGRVATSILAEDQLMEQVVELIRDRFGFYHVQIFLVNETGQTARLHKSTGQAGEELLAQQHQLAVGSSTVIGQTTAHRRSMVVRSTDLPGSGPALNVSPLLPLTQAQLGIPIQVGATLLGALDVQSSQANAFSDEDISTLEALVAQLAIAIQNARVFREQQETAERLKEIDKLKTQFLANMSHELRTPLNSIIGFSRVILKGIDGPLTELQKADLTSIHNSGQHLLGLINNILDLSKIEAGKMELNFEDTEVAPIVKTVMSTAIALVKDKQVTLHQEVPENLPKIWADTTRLRQIILNLVSNACKFTDEGTVTTKVYAKDNRVYFSVIDTGIGIPKEKLEHVFEEFTQVDASTTRKVGGTGLGLPISRHFVEMHHGKIWVESEIGEGTTFTFFIPTHPPLQAPPELAVNQPVVATPPVSPHQKTVVVVDDDPAMINLYRRILEPRHYNVLELNSGREAAARIKEIAPYAVVLDILVPGKDGWTILKELKEDSFTKNIPVIIGSIVSDKNRGFALGAAGYLVKPIAENELVAALSHLDNRQKGAIKVLLVDDNADDTLLVRRILEAQEEYTIFEAANGKEGMALVKSKSPDLIILDLNMPEMDGFAMIAALKENGATSHIPIIIVSAQEPTPAEQEKLSAQVKVQLRKGIFTEQELLEDVNLAIAQITLPEKTVI